MMAARAFHGTTHHARHFDALDVQKCWRCCAAAWPQLHRTALAKIDNASLPGFGSEGDELAIRTPRERSDRRVGWPARQDFRAVVDTHEQHEPVGVTDRNDRLIEMAGYCFHLRLAGCEQLRPLAHGPVLRAERPQDELVR